MGDERVMWMSRQAAALLPEAPMPHDPFGYLAWEELVLTTARRLEPFLTSADTAADAAVPVLRLMPGTCRLDAESLVALAVLLARDPDAAPASCETMLHDAVDISRGQVQAKFAALTRVH